MTAKEHIKNIGKEAEYPLKNGLFIRIKITDIKMAFGRIDYEVSPLSGSGLAWVSADSLIFD